jgi:hypothetical protein
MFIPCPVSTNPVRSCFLMPYGLESISTSSCLRVINYSSLIITENTPNKLNKTLPLNLITVCSENAFSITDRL